MKTFTAYNGYTVEEMYKSIAELLACWPECKVYDDGQWRVVRMPVQKFPPVVEEEVFILLEYCDIDGWEEHVRWVVIADDGEHPNGYATKDEALAAIGKVQKAA